MESDEDSETCDEWSLEEGPVPPRKQVHSRENVKIHKCKQCDYTTTDKSQMAKHFISHDKSRRYGCDICHRRFFDFRGLTIHISAKHDAPDPRECPTCFRVFNNPEKLAYHERHTHAKVKAYKCQLCSFSASQSNRITKHMLTHTTDRPYKCAHCKYAAKDPHSLNRHMFGHSAFKPFKCEICQLGFNQRFLLTKHKGVYHPYATKHKCNLCNAAFDNEVELRVHVGRIHTVEAPLSCDQCDHAAFTDKFAFKEHKRLHALKQCDICDFKYQCKAHYDLHMKTHKVRKRAVEPIAESPSVGLIEDRHASEVAVEVKGTKAASKSLKRKGDVDFTCSLKKRMKSLIENSKTVGTDRRLSCESCSRTFRTERQIKSHTCAAFESDDIDGGLFSDEEKKEIISNGNARFSGGETGTEFLGKMENLKANVLCFVAISLLKVVPETMDYFNRGCLSSNKSSRVRWNCMKCDHVTMTSSELRRHLKTHSDAQQLCESVSASKYYFTPETPQLCEDEYEEKPSTINEIILPAVDIKHEIIEGPLATEGIVDVGPLVKSENSDRGDIIEKGVHSLSEIDNTVSIEDPDVKSEHGFSSIGDTFNRPQEPAFKVKYAPTKHELYYMDKVRALIQNGGRTIVSCRPVTLAEKKVILADQMTFKQCKQAFRDMGRSVYYKLRKEARQRNVIKAKIYSTTQRMVGQGFRRYSGLDYEVALQLTKLNYKSMSLTAFTELVNSVANRVLQDEKAKDDMAMECPSFYVILARRLDYELLDEVDDEDTMRKYRYWKWGGLSENSLSNDSRPLAVESEVGVGGSEGDLVVKIENHDSIDAAVAQNEGNKLSDSSLKKAYKCKLCSYTGKRLDLLKRHNMLSHRLRHKCEICGMSFTRWGSLAKHKQKWHPDRLYKCGLCSSTFSLELELKVHVDGTHAVVEEMRCAECNQVFNDKQYYQEHRKIHEIYNCDSCSFTTAVKPSLVSHLLTHNKQPKSAESNVAPTSSSAQPEATAKTAPVKWKPEDIERSGFQAEKESEDEAGGDQMKLKCRFCHKKYAKRKCLTRHVTRIHSKIVEEFVCDICRKKFHHPDDLNQHITRTHRDKVPHECSVCFKVVCGAKWEKSLKRHARTHSTERPFKCGSCTYSAKDRTHLNRHLLRHSGDKPYNCDLCERGFTRRSALFYHKGKFHGGKDVRYRKSDTSLGKADCTHKCRLCSAAFQSEAGLKTHIGRSHSDQEPIKCGDCDQFFNGRHAYREHMKEHSLVMCGVCNWRTNSKYFLERHLKQHSKTKLKPVACKDAAASSSEDDNPVTTVLEDRMSSKNSNENEMPVETAVKHDDFSSRSSKASPFTVKMVNLPCLEEEVLDLQCLV